MFTEWLIEYGLWSLALLMLLQNLIPLLPSEVIMPLAGFLASLGYLDLKGAILAGLFGSLLGHLPWYAAGRLAGADRLLRVASRYGRWVGLGGRRAAQAERWFRRNAGRAVLLGRLVPGLRTAVNIPAGASRMPMGPFLGYTALGDALWTATLAWGGYVLGREYHLVSLYFHMLALPLAGAAILVIAFLMRRRRARRRASAAGAAMAWGARFPGIPKGA